MTRQRVIYKYPIEDFDKPVRVPIGVVRRVAAQHPADLYPTVWVEHLHDDLLLPPEKRKFMIEFTVVGTGMFFDHNPYLQYAGSAVCGEHGQGVWHVYYRAVSAKDH